MILNFFNRFLTNRFFIDVGTLVSGSFLGQLILLIATPFLTRIYSPEDFGVYFIYISFSTVLAIFTTGRYEFAIALPKFEKDGKDILKLIFLLGFLVTLFYLITVISYIFLADPETFHFNYFKNNFLFLIPLSALIASINTGLVYMIQRKKMYKTASISVVLQNLVLVFTNLSIGLFVSVKWGLVLGLITGQVLSILFLFFRLKYNFSIFYFDYSKLLLAAKKYINFPKFKLFSDLAAVSSQQLTPIIFSFLFNNFIVGNFALANRFLRLPTIILTSSIENVFRNDALDEIRKTGKCDRLFLQTIKKLTFISLPIFILIAGISPIVFPILFGDEWIEAGKMGQIIAFAMILDFISLPFNSLFYIHNEQKMMMYLQLANTFISLIMILLGNYLYNSALASVLFYSIGNVCFNAVCLSISFNLSKKQLKNI